MLKFLWDNSFLIFCILGLIWLCSLVLTQIKYKKRGAYLEGIVVGNVNQGSTYFPVYEFEYNGQKLRVDSYNGEKNPLPEGEKEMIYYLPGNQKGVFAERNAGIKLWQIVSAAALMVVIVLSIVKLIQK